MARSGKAAGQQSGHYLAAVAGVSLVVAALAWFARNGTLAVAAGALGFYALHLLSVRFLLENQTRQREVLDAQWEVLQRFIGSPEAEPDTGEELVPPMPGEIDEAPTSAAPSPQVPVVPPAESLTDGAGIPLLDPGRDGNAPEAGAPGPGRQSRTSEVPVPRHFALGTVALVRDLLSPAEVARVLLEQRRQPGKKFGELAVEMGLMTESEREELLLAQQEGLFTDAEMREARRRLREFRESAAHSMAGLD